MSQAGARLTALMPKVRDALKRMERTKQHLQNDAPFFGAAALKLTLVETDAVQTVATNGTLLKYNPAFIDSITDEQAAFEVAHEASHCILLHPWRLKGRDLATFNDAADYIINYQLKQAGMYVPADALFNPEYDDRYSTESLYAKLMADRTPPPAPEQPEQPQPDDDGDEQEPEPEPEADEQPGEDQDDDDGDTDGDEPDAGDDDDDDTNDAGDTAADSGDPDDDEQPDEEQAPEPKKQTVGHLEPAPEDDEPQTDADGQPIPTQDMESWVVESRQMAALCEKMGTLPGGARRFITAEQEATEDWRQLLRAFMEQANPSDYAWTRMPAAYLIEDVYMPGMARESLGRIAIIIDTSSSVTQGQLNAQAPEYRAIMQELRPEAMDVIYIDTQIQRVDTFTPDGPPLTLNLAGGGGTYLTPAFDYLESHPDGPPKVAICATDLYCEPLREPSFPVLFLVPQGPCGAIPPFGQTVRIPVAEA